MAGAQGADVTILWETGRPYESVVQSSGVGVHLIGLKLRHSSPSVANNYAVYMHGGSLLLEVCASAPVSTVLEVIRQGV